METTMYNEAMRYLNNAKEILNKAGHEGNYYKDVKYVKSAAGTAYEGVHLAAQWFIYIKKGIAPSLLNTKEEITKQLGTIDKRAMNLFNTNYAQLHKAIYYEGDKSIATTKTANTNAKKFIMYLQPFKDAPIYDKGGPIDKIDVTAIRKQIDNMTKADISLSREEAYNIIVAKKTNGLQPTDYNDKTDKQIWDVWNEEQREHFLMDHIKAIDEKYRDHVVKEWDELPEITKIALYTHINKNRYDKGGKTTTTQAYFSSLNISELPEKAQIYLKDELLPDTDLALLDETDADFTEIKTLIETTFPKALPTYKEPEPKPEVKELTKQDYKDRISGLRVMAETSTGKAKKDYRATIGGLKTLMEFAPKELAKGGRTKNQEVWIELSYKDLKGIDWGKDRLLEDKIEEILTEAGIERLTDLGVTLDTLERNIIFRVSAKDKDKAIKAIKAEFDKLNIRRKDVNIRSGIVIKPEGDRSREDRPSPTDSATIHGVGYQKKGNDGNIWEVKATAKGIQRWVKVKSMAKGGKVWGVEVRKTADSYVEQMEENLTKEKAEEIAQKYRDSGKYYHVKVEIPLPFAEGGRTSLRGVRVTYGDDTVISTSMAAHLTDAEIKGYFKVGKMFDVGVYPKENMQPVKKVEILMSEGGKVETVYDAKMLEGFTHIKSKRKIREIIQKYAPEMWEILKKEKATDAIKGAYVRPDKDGYRTIFVYEKEDVDAPVWKIYPTMEYMAKGGKTKK